MDDIIVTSILLVLSVIVIASIALGCRLLTLYSWHVATREPTSVPDQHSHYDVTKTLHANGRNQSEYDPLYGTTYPPPIHRPGDVTKLEFPQVTDGFKASPPSDDALAVECGLPSSAGLQRALSCDSVGSDTSCTDGDMDELATKIGQLEFGLDYKIERSELEVSVLQARDLERNEITGTLDSYIKVWLTPREEKRFQTKVQRDTVCPQFMERFQFSVVPSELDNKTVQFQVYSCDKYARHKLLGETELRLGDIDLRQPVRVWMNLHDMDQKPVDLGDILFSLNYLPTAERLTMVISKARNLNWPSTKLVGDCCVKIYLLQNGKKITKKKTTNKHEDRNPTFNEAMTFSVPHNTLQTVQIKVRVNVTLPDGRVHHIGHVIVGSQVTGTELVHWTQTMTSLRKPVTMWHCLRK